MCEYNRFYMELDHWLDYNNDIVYWLYRHFIPVLRLGDPILRRGFQPPSCHGIHSRDHGTDWPQYGQWVAGPIPSHRSPIHK